jgi:hypothetical protein
MNEPQTEPTIAEEDLLRAEAEQARIALREALLGIKNSFVRTADPAEWARTHPWVSVGVAAATGFAAASAIIPSPGQRAADKWSGVMSRLTPQQLAASTNGSLPPSATAPNPSASIWTSVIDSLFDLAKVAITNFITVMVQSRGAPASTNDATEKPAQDESSCDVRSDLRND